MARTTKQLSGGGKDKFLRGIVAAEPAIDGDAAKRIADTLSDAITEVRVRREVWEATSKPLPGEKGLRAAKAKAAAARAPSVAAEPEPTAKTQPALAPVPTAAFDPFAFSAVALLTRKGKPALAAELAKISSAADLKALAAAQHLAIDMTVDDPSALRDAIATATERRIAERRAAAG